MHSVDEYAFHPKTRAAYARSYDDYREFCKACGDDPLPYTYVKVARFHIAYFMALKGSAKSLAKIGTALRHIGTRVNEKWLSTRDNKRLIWLRRGLGKLDVDETKHALALVLSLLQRMGDEGHNRNITWRYRVRNPGIV